MASYQYAYDNAGNVTQLHDGITSSYNRDFAYDDLNRLITANSGTSLWGNGAYTYDKMGNRLTAVFGSFTRTFNYSGASPKLTSEVEGTATLNVTYDAAGNELTVGTSTFAYTPRNELGNRDGIRYGYDGRGVRTTTTQLSGEIVRTLYLPELSMMAETAASTATAPPISYEYIWFGGEPLAQVDNTTGSIHWYFNDHLARPLLMTSSNAAIIWRPEYDPYGAVALWRVSSSERQPLRFPGQEKEGGSDLSYNVFRWYRTNWGRYTQADPVHMFQPLSEESQAYGYAINNPLKFKDPLGLYTVSGSCARCENIDARDTRNISEFILEETSRWCRERLSGVTDVRLRNCMRESCRNGRVECIDCDEPGLYGKSDTRAGVIGHWFARRSPNRTVYVCVGTQGNYLGDAGGTVVHEWAHGCGCDADIAGECPGIPGLPTGRTYQRRTPRRR